MFMTMYQYLSHLVGITVKLQKKALDIVEAHEMISEISKVYQDEQKMVDSSFAPIYTQSVRMAEKVGTVPGMPSITSRQQHRCNAEASSPREYFKRNVAIPVLDTSSCVLISSFHHQLLLLLRYLVLSQVSYV